MDTAEDNLHASVDKPMMPACKDPFFNPFLPEPLFPAHFHFSADLISASLLQSRTTS
jgi:hypothetical protein